MINHIFGNRFNIEIPPHDATMGNFSCAYVACN